MSRATVRTTIVLAALLVGMANAYAAGSLLRVACEGGDVGAEVYVNGKFRGECPLDVQVSEGVVNLRVAKKLDADRERSFEQQVRVADGTIKKLDVALSAPQFNPAARRRVEQEFAALLQAAEAGDPRAMFRVAYRYEQGSGIARNDVAANDWYRKAAEAGNDDAMTNLAFRYQTGNGMARDAAEAASWYRRAADVGNATAMNNLASLYLGGQGVSRDPAEAVRWFERAAAAGYAEAAANLGYQYATGRIIAKNEALAAEWYRKAADGGSPRGMFGIAGLYADGRGVARDADEAVRWYRAAAAKGYSPAQEELKKRGLQ
jgi:TPR repeat protein